MRRCHIFPYILLSPTHINSRCLQLYIGLNGNETFELWYRGSFHSLRNCATRMDGETVRLACIHAASGEAATCQWILFVSKLNNMQKIYLIQMRTRAVIYSFRALFLLSSVLVTAHTSSQPRSPQKKKKKFTTTLVRDKAVHTQARGRGVANPSG